MTEVRQLTAEDLPALVTEMRRIMPRAEWAEIINPLNIAYRYLGARVVVADESHPMPVIVRLPTVEAAEYHADGGSWDIRIGDSVGQLPWCASVADYATGITDRLTAEAQNMAKRAVRLSNESAAILNIMDDK